jgi:hypothetical protein
MQQEDSDATVVHRVWRTLPVKVLSARAFDYAGGSSFYDEEMKWMIAAEHSMHALLGLTETNYNVSDSSSLRVPSLSARYVMPTVGHDQLFLETECIAQCTAEVGNAIRWKEKSVAER